MTVLPGNGRERATTLTQMLLRLTPNMTMMLVNAGKTGRFAKTDSVYKATQLHSKITASSKNVIPGEHKDKVKKQCCCSKPLGRIDIKLVWKAACTKCETILHVQGSAGHVQRGHVVENLVPNKHELEPSIPGRTS